MVKKEKDYSFLNENIMEILKAESSQEKPMGMTKLRSRLEEKYDQSPTRSTLYSRMSALETRKCGIKKAEDAIGYYYEPDENGFSDGELRMLIDSVMYSGMLPDKYSADIIEKLSVLGTPSFAKNMRKQAILARSVTKKANKSIIMSVEDIQEAILKKKQISFNYITHNIVFEDEFVFSEDIVVNPYELAFSQGKYYLVCSISGEDNISTFRVERIRCLSILETKCVENKAFERIKNGGGMQKYIYSQPELCGGTIEKFKILCYNDSFDDVYDYFGNSLKIVNEKMENYDDPDTVMISVETTREAIMAWAFMNSEKAVIVEPQDLRSEIEEKIKTAKHTYNKTGKPAFKRQYIAYSFSEAIHETEVSGKRFFRYYSRKRKSQKEKVNINALNCLKLNNIYISNCDLTDNIITESFDSVRSLSLVNTNYNQNIFDYFPSLENITVSGESVTSLEFLKHYENIKALIIGDFEYIPDFTPLYNLKSLSRLDITDYTAEKMNIERIQTQYPECEIRIHDSIYTNHSMTGEKGK